MEKNMIEKVENNLRAAIKEGLVKTLEQADITLEQIPDIKVEVPREKEHGDYATNIAMVMAKHFKRAPRQIAELLKENIEADLIKDISVAGPGFINFNLENSWLYETIDLIDKLGKDYGKVDVGDHRRVLIEFVSANPTGPLTVGHGRQAVLGDCIARILEWNGYDVHREYYYNDAGRQMRILGYSTYIRYRQLLGYDEEMPEDYYQGQYIKEIARKIVDEFGDKYKDNKDADIFREYAEKAVFKDINNTLQELGIGFDHYFNEKNLYENGKIDAVLNHFEKIGASYEKNGATWFKASQYGVDEDRVLWKSVADEATYRLPDIAYHQTKFERSFDRIVDVFGADHHAAYPDVLAGLRALGYDTDQVEVIIHQFVTLMKGTQKIKMSTRKANYVTLDELIDEVGKDVVRYFFIMRKAKSQLNFDLELAKKEGEGNPVFYLQYAHARICSILKKAEGRDIDLNKDGNLPLLSEQETLDLLYVLEEFKELISLCGESLEPQHITRYLEKLATAFHKFYTECRVLSDDRDLTQARLEVVRAVQTVMANGLSIIGVDAPERM